MIIPEEFEPLLKNNWREAAVYGGRYSMKSHTVARILLIRARQGKKRIACFREFQNSIADSSHQLLADLIMQYDLKDFIVTEKSIYNTLTESDFIFKGLHRNEQSVKSTEGIDIAWCEEAQTLTTSSLEVLTPTIRKPGSQIIYTYNRLRENDPVHQRLVLEGRPNSIQIKVDYRLAEKYGILPEGIKDEIESDRINRPNLYRHKWLGEPISNENRIYADWATIDEIPHEARLIKRGLDFGYSNDPTALVAVYYYNGGYIIDEELYKLRMRNDQIANYILSLKEPNVPVIADAAEPKSIDEIAIMGVNILPVQKTSTLNKGFVNASIDYVQSQRISVTRRSRNLLREYGEYIWELDKDGRPLNKPPDTNNHCMDAIRYALWDARHVEENDFPTINDTIFDKDGFL